MLSKRQLMALSDFRFELARFLRFSEHASRTVGITPLQYLLLLHIRGFRGRDSASVGELALRLQASPHGTAALVERCATSGLVRKRRAAGDRRRVDVHLSPRGHVLVERIARRHRAELRQLRAVFRVTHVG
ncbi:MAG TPA: MarR family transcriptional regulator [Steroidobacteraceae bacterium]|jgi:DNA-binding MarR family transcriptional regulator